MLPLKHRLPLRLFRHQVESHAQTFRSPLFTLLVAHRLPTDDHGLTIDDHRPSRFAIILSKKISNQATIRNRLRRQTLATIQEHLLLIKPGFDIIILANKPLSTATYDQINSAINSQLRQSGLIT